MPYYMTHPEHGTHICYTPEDVEAHKAIGWVDTNEKPAEEQPQERKKPGPKPKAK